MEWNMKVEILPKKKKYQKSPVKHTGLIER